MHHFLFIIKYLNYGNNNQAIGDYYENIKTNF